MPPERALRDTAPNLKTKDDREWRLSVVVEAAGVQGGGSRANTASPRAATNGSVLCSAKFLPDFGSGAWTSAGAGGSRLALSARSVRAYLSKS